MGVEVGCCVAMATMCRGDSYTCPVTVWVRGGTPRSVRATPSTDLGSFGLVLDLSYLTFPQITFVRINIVFI